MKWDKDTNSGKSGRKSAILAVSGALILTGLLSGAALSEQMTIQELLKRRTDIIQMVWYSELTPEQGETLLKEIETHPLLGEDLTWLRAAEEGMDFSYVLDMEIRDLVKTSRSSAGTCYQAEILWELEERNRHVTETHDYRIRAVTSTDGTVRLSEFEVL